MTTILRIKGMHCASCKLLIEDVCREFPEVQSCNVNVEEGNLTIEHAPELDLSRVIQEISSLGSYQVTLS